MEYESANSKPYIQNKLRAAIELLDLVDKRFEPKASDDAKLIYYWILDIERKAKQIGMKFYSHQGKSTLIGILKKGRLWLRSNVYESPIFSASDLLNSNNRLKPQKIENRFIDFEKLIDDIACETKELRKLFQDYAAKEKRLIEEMEQLARDKVKRVAVEHTSINP